MIIWSKRLIVYIFVHLVHCTRNKSCFRAYPLCRFPFDVVTRALSGFKEALQQWHAWDITTKIENHLLIKGYLTDLFQEYLQVYLQAYHFRNSTTDLYCRTYHTTKARLENCSA